MSERLTSLRFRQNAAEAVLNPSLRQALRTTTDTIRHQESTGNRIFSDGSLARCGLGNSDAGFG